MQWRAPCNTQFALFYDCELFLLWIAEPSTVSAQTGFRWDSRIEEAFTIVTNLRVVKWNFHLMFLSRSITKLAQYSPVQSVVQLCRSMSEKVKQGSPPKGEDSLALNGTWTRPFISHFGSLEKWLRWEENATILSPPLRAILIAVGPKGCLE